MNAYLSFITFVFLSAMFSLECMNGGIQVLSQPAAPHTLSYRRVAKHMVPLDPSDKQKCLNIRLLMFKKKFHEALAALKEKNAIIDKPLVIDRIFFIQAVTAGYLPIIHEALKHEEVRVWWVESALLGAAMDEKIPIIRRLLGELLILCWKDSDGYEKRGFDNSIARISHGLSPAVVDCINSFCASINWQNVEQTINDVSLSIKAHESVITHNMHIMSDCLSYGNPFILHDEYDELILSKAKRLVKEENDPATRRKRALFANMLAIFAKRGYKIFDLLKDFAKEQTPELKNLISALLKGWSPFLSSSFCDADKNNVLHVAVDLNLLDFAKLITCLNHKLVGCTNTRGENPILRAQGQGRKAIYEWFCNLPSEVEQNKLREAASARKNLLT